MRYNSAMKDKRKQYRSYVLVFVAVLIGVFWIIFSHNFSFVEPDQVKIGSATFRTKTVQTKEDRTKGLSGTASLSQDEAMLFIFPQAGRHGIWMKDMNYPIDILWLNPQKVVTDIKKAAQPASYPNETFYPGSDAKYVLEVAAGVVDARNINVGDQAIFAEGGGEL